MTTTKFSELNELFKPWRDEWLKQYRQHQALPFAIAEAFREFLGCPKTYVIPPDQKAANYVSPCIATRDSDANAFKLTVNGERWKDIDIDEDSYFYFGLQCHLEMAPNAYPKQPFWFLLRSEFRGDVFKVRIVRSGDEFELSAEQPNSSAEPLCQRLYELIKLDMETPAMMQRKPKNKIGFMS